MNWLFNTLSSSIGKKLLMAVTGLSFCGFLTTHLLGNLTVYGGPDAFNEYVEKLHSLGELITIAEWVLLLFFITHVLTGLILFVGNLNARPVGYAVKKNGGGRTIGSRTMPYTGVLLLMFIIYHLMGFHFVDHAGRTVFEIVSEAFTNPVNVAIYIAAVVIAAIHVSHGLWSGFHTIGAAHPKYTPLFKGLALVFAVVVGVGFGFLPVYISVFI